MTLEGFITALQGAGLEPQVDDVLDVFWLATRGRPLALHRPRPTAPCAANSPVVHQSMDDADSPVPPATTDEDAALGEGPSRAQDKLEVPVYPSGRTEDKQRTISASAVALPAGQPLSGRLRLARALRPLRQRWPSRHAQEIDEPRTVEATAESRGVLHPVFRPVPEFWFDCHVVAEDDPTIALWHDGIQGLCRMLEDTGAFRSVQSWGLRGTAGEGPHAVYLEGSAGFRAPIRLLTGRGVRRLIFFVTHGNSAGWLDGRYAAVLASWAPAASVVILHLFDQHRWKRGTLGEPQGLCRARETGAVTAALDVETFWWAASAGQAGFLPMPAVPLTPAGLSTWALTLMGRGRASPVILLDSAPLLDLGAEPVAAPAEFEQAAALLRESSPAAFRLAVYLCASAFTIPVARVIQEAQFGAAACQSQLAEVLLSGLVFAHAPPANVDPAESWFECYPEARAILLRSLREADALAVGDALEQRVSRYMERISGRSITFRALVPDANGKYELPEWAQPFARFGLALPRPAGDTRTPEQRLAEFIAACPRPVLASVARYVASITPGAALQPAALEPEAWQTLLHAGLIDQDSAGQWRFLPGMEPLLARLAPGIAPDRPTAFRDRLADGTDGPEMVWLPGGTFRMGSPEGVGGNDERPAHQVALGHYAVGKYPVTVGEFRRFVAATGYRTEAETGDGGFVRTLRGPGRKIDASWRTYVKQDGDHPVVFISWNDAQAYCAWLSRKTDQTYGLLTEAQWEYACRAGSAGVFCFGDDAARLVDYGWYFENAGDGTHPVGKKLPNAWGLHDLHGNVWEWCQDWYSGDYYRQVASGAQRDSQSVRKDASAAAVSEGSSEQPVAKDPSGPESGSDRIVRGGAWAGTAVYCRSAYRDKEGPSNRYGNLGFRLSRTGPWHSYPITLVGEPPRGVPEPSIPAAKPQFAPYEVFRDRLDVKGPDGAKTAVAAPEMVYLPGGIFQMGDAQGNDREKPVHPVRVDAFALGRTAVTWGQYLRFSEATGKRWPEWLETGSEYHLETGKNDFYAKRGVGRAELDLPVVGISWEDARAYCDWLSVQTGEQYALPTEAQWEYACRAGTTTRWCCGDDAAGLRDYGWFGENADRRLHPVGQKRANAWGLYDMHGNVWEWCADWYSGDYYQQLSNALRAAVSSTERIASGARQPASENPNGPESGSGRVCRGGAWILDADFCRCAYRIRWRPSYRYGILGFRLSRTV